MFYFSSITGIIFVLSSIELLNKRYDPATLIMMDLLLHLRKQSIKHLILFDFTNYDSFKFLVVALFQYIGISYSL